MSQKKEMLLIEEPRKRKLSIEEPRKGKLSIEELSMEPRATVHHNFHSKKECDHLISLAKPQLTRSKVFDLLAGGGTESSSLTSSGMFLKRGQVEIVRTIEKRIADYTSVPIGPAKISWNKGKLSTEEPRKGKLSIEELSTEPRAMVYHNFLSMKECDHLISLAKPHLTRSKVVDPLTGGGKESSSRTNSGMFLKRGQVEIVRRIEKRIADYTSVPIVPAKMSWNKGKLSIEEPGKGKLTIQELSMEPRATVYHNFLSKKECDHLISLAKPHLTRSKVVDPLTGRGKDSSSRTSSGMFLKRGQDDIVRTIEKRIADYTSIPIENGEGLQVLHYVVGQKFEPHFDYTDGTSTTKVGGPRMATFLMYLLDVEVGGETVFPNATGKGRAPSAKSGISVKPKMGDALFFWSMKPDGSRDPKSLHCASPVIKGDKWSATKWMHVNKYY